MIENKKPEIVEEDEISDEANKRFFKIGIKIIGSIIAAMIICIIAICILENI